LEISNKTSLTNQNEESSRLKYPASKFEMSKSKLEEPQPTVTLRGILQGFLVSVVNVQWYGSTAVELTCKVPCAKLGNEVLYRHVETRIEVVKVERRCQISSLPPAEPAGPVALMTGKPAQTLTVAANSKQVVAARARTILIEAVLSLGEIRAESAHFEKLPFGHHYDARGDQHIARHKEYA
jgi:hypothetical protein